MINIFNITEERVVPEGVTYQRLGKYSGDDLVDISVKLGPVFVLSGETAQPGNYSVVNLEGRHVDETNSLTVPEGKIFVGYGNDTEFFGSPAILVGDEGQTVTTTGNGNPYARGILINKNK